MKCRHSYSFGAINLLQPIAVAAQSKAWTVFDRSNDGIMGSNPIQATDICIVCVYSVFVLFCVYLAALRRTDSSSKEYYRLCID
jgi:hypothetical protein